MIQSAKARLTARQVLLIRNLVKGMSLTDAALKAGYSENCPGQSGYQALQAITLKMPQALEQHGLTDNVLIQKYLIPALEAHETKFAQKDGEFTDERDVIAWGPRLQALDMTLNLKGSYPSKDSASALVNVQINTNIQVPEP